jgi:tRNA(His) 5'-end guanylyltransferase
VHFDSRVFQIPDPVEVENYFVARQKDAVRNSVSMLAQGHFSPKQLHGVSVEKMHDMLVSVNDNWNNHPPRYKQGAAIAKVMQPAYMKETKVGTVEIPPHDEWAMIDDTPIFTKDREWLSSRIPRYPV